MQKPTIGRIVHYYPANETTPQAAIVIEVYSDSCVKLQRCNSGGTWCTSSSVVFNEDPGFERWVWPPKA
jgi:hypothetical protein